MSQLISIMSSRFLFGFDLASMSQIYIIVEYNGKWKKVDGGFWRWFGVGMSKGFVFDRSIKFLELEETIYDRTSINRRFHDDYFGCRINEEISFVARFVPTELVGSYEHPLQICATSTPINERITGFNPNSITGSNPTPEETVPEEVANEDYRVPEEDDSRWQYAESEETRFVPLISSDSGRNDGSDLMVGKHFDSKEELNTKLNLVAINGKFEMKVKKSTKSLKEVVCVEEPNCLWRV
ncbi:hypothetical protein TIFTF001_007711 [Ficus carica]|uniref:Transposase MuDR plant domain-containing protein n=1 Tax=Ficus carica TaxID=3494 RepID=A0AA88A3G6_FICCA|nr:hypothetical protein TIFTF001_007711 [Ficus carica]